MVYPRTGLNRLRLPRPILEMFLTLYQHYTQYSASQPPKTPRTTHPVSHKPHAQKQLTSQPYARQRCSHAPLSAFMQMARFVHVYARRTRLVPPVLVVPPPPPLRLALLLALALAETAPLLPAESTLVEEPIVLMVVRQS